MYLLKTDSHWRQRATNYHFIIQNKIDNDLCLWYDQFSPIQYIMALKRLVKFNQWWYNEHFSISTILLYNMQTANLKISCTSKNDQIACLKKWFIFVGKPGTWERRVPHHISSCCMKQDFSYLSLETFFKSFFPV